MIKLKTILQEQGYDWSHGKSNNAVFAEEIGKNTISTLSKILLIPSKILSKYLQPSEWHHTSSMFNKTNYYYEPILIDIKNNLTNEEILEKIVFTYKDIFESYVDTYCIPEEIRDIIPLDETEIANDDSCKQKLLIYINEKRELYNMMKQEAKMAKKQNEKIQFNNCVVEFLEFQRLSGGRYNVEKHIIKNAVVEYTTSSLFVNISYITEYNNSHKSFKKKIGSKGFIFKPTEEDENYSYWVTNILPKLNPPY